MAEGLLYRPANKTETKDLSAFSIEWLTKNGESDIDIVSVTAVYSNSRGHFYEVHYTCDDGCLEGLLEIKDNQGNWVVKEV